MNDRQQQRQARPQSSPQQFAQGNRIGMNGAQYENDEHFSNVAGPDSNGHMMLMKNDLSSYGNFGTRDEVSINVNSGGLRPSENLRRYDRSYDAPGFSSSSQRNQNLRRYDPMYDPPEGTFALDDSYERRRRNENLRRYDPMYDGPEGTINADDYNRQRRNENLRRYDPQYDMPEGTSASNFDSARRNGGYSNSNRSRFATADGNGQFDLMGNRPGAAPVTRRSQAEWSPFRSDMDRSETTMYTNGMQAPRGFDTGKRLRRWEGAEEESGYYRDSVGDDDWRWQDSDRMRFKFGADLQPTTPQGLFNNEKEDRMFNDYSDVTRRNRQY
jgi:hypothetical protein